MFVSARPCQVETCMILLFVVGWTNRLKSSARLNLFTSLFVPPFNPVIVCPSSSGILVGLVLLFLLAWSHTQCAQIQGLSYPANWANPRLQRRFSAAAADLADSMASSCFCGISWMPWPQMETCWAMKGMRKFRIGYDRVYQGQNWSYEL